MQDLKQVFDVLAENGMVINRSKCILGKPSLDFLGYKVNKDSIAPLEHRVEAIIKTTPPTSVKELQRFLGMINYYRRFLPRAAHHLYHLFEALRNKPKVLKWDDNCQRSFEAIKSALIKATMLHHPRSDAHFAITSDASNYAIGAVLEQRGPLGWEPLSFFSARLNPNQKDWPPFDRELLAAFRSIRHFKHFIEGRQFTLYTDHQSGAGVRKEDRAADCQTDLPAVGDCRIYDRHSISAGKGQCGGRCPVSTKRINEPNYPINSTHRVSNADISRRPSPAG